VADRYRSLQNKCALYWPEGDTKTDTYNIHEGSITVTLKEKPTVTSSYIKRVFDVVKQQVITIYIFNFIRLFESTTLKHKQQAEKHQIRLTDTQNT